MDENTRELLSFARDELRVLAEQGCDTWDLERAVELAGTQAERGQARRLADLLEQLKALAPRADFPYEEPSELDQIRAARPAGPRRIAVGVDPDVVADRTLGGWLGRAAGCMLGKPVEGWPRERVEDRMALCGLQRLDDYWPGAPGEEQSGFRSAGGRLLRGGVSGAVRDDDLDYTVVGLRLLEDHGPQFTPRQAAEFWLGHLPYHLTYTAERLAYRNFVNGTWPPESATHRNPFREYIGAQIRADAFGYARPGRPEAAADMAFRDGCISHVRNGIYGEMWVAAMLAAAFVTPDARKVVEIGLSEVPEHCRLAEAVRSVLARHERGAEPQACMDAIINDYGRYSRVHTINNAALVAMALLYGQGDFSRTLGLAVRGGWDTDCNGATAGSVAGVMLGADALPDHWTAPLEDRLETAVAGESALTFSGLAERTQRVRRPD